MQYPEVRALAGATHNVISRSDLLQLISRRTMCRWVEKGWLFEWAPRAYGIHPKPEWREMLHAIQVSSPDLHVSHRSALRLLELMPASPLIYEFIGPHATRRLESARIHETNYMPESHLMVCGGTSVTTAARSIIDAGAVWGPQRLRSIINRAIDRRAVTIHQLRAMVEDVRSKGRRTKFVEQIIFDSRYDEAKAGSELEREGLSLIAAAGLPRPSVQHAIKFRDFTLHPDLCYPQIRLAIEFDGFEHHGTRFAFHDDRERDALLAIEGWHVVRFSFHTLHLLVPTIRARMKKGA